VPPVSKVRPGRLVAHKGLLDSKVKLGNKVLLDKLVSKAQLALQARQGLWVLLV
jgi:hypothetical protein